MTIPYHFTDAEAQAFVEGYSKTVIDGAPFSIPGGWGLQVRTLQDYINLKYPPWGVVVTPQHSTDKVMVWFDDRNALHVVDITGMSIASEIPKANFESPDSSLLDALIRRVREVASGLPSASNALSTISLVAVAVILSTVLGGRRQ